MCLELLETHPGPLLVPMLVATAEVRFLGDLAAGNLIPEPVAPVDWIRIAELVTRYADLPLGTVVAAVERRSVTAVATLDRRHFAVVQSTRGPARPRPVGPPVVHRPAGRRTSRRRTSRQRLVSFQ
jgi:hypothetical protein